ncbi:ATP-binding cassette domain-containing protein [Aeromonas simiae]|uniref:ATP-binding cassette domain-containing protein n=1 Tax=Aeromonas simiae TaxID=218936 RepID=UPI00266B3F7A|nr:ATP-binding cassette domain-containing protein [Aeromonas simiae]MDO2949617.1 ATP-binding cassette domain-containing protein [Aeromonas simiae]MDO2953324.1 ATP-binding cassette domain-containing protein [Aeromonas simiae]MDO2956948.1 ATP-binding cassette domain-containing protein [Aeromonas simiae]
MFEMNGAGFAIDGKPLLQPTTLRFDEGRVYGLIGHNGSGKSTLLKLLARQQPFSSGDILLDGRSLREWEARPFARRVAYLPQHLPPADNLLGRELIGFGRFPWRGLFGRTRNEDKAQVARAIALTHTEAFADRLVDTLSGGERQRVWLAMLLAQESRFILLDEPLAALDVAHQVEVMSLVHDLSRQLGLGVIVVIHDINMAARYCDELVALHGGRVLTQGTPGELMREETLKAIYGLPMRVIPHPQSAHPIAIV